MEKVELKPDEIQFIKSFTSNGSQNVREVTRAQILLALHKGKKMEEIADFFDIDRSSVWRLKKKYKEIGAENAIKDKPRPGQPNKYNEKDEAGVVALACSNPPKGREKWTLELLKEKVQKKKRLKDINKESIRLMLKKNNVSLG